MKFPRNWTKMPFTRWFLPTWVTVSGSCGLHGWLPQHLRRRLPKKRWRQISLLCSSVTCWHGTAAASTASRRNVSSSSSRNSCSRLWQKMSMRFEWKSCPTTNLKSPLACVKACEGAFYVKFAWKNKKI